MNKMDWKAEKEKIEGRGEWFDPQINSNHEIEILENIDDSYYFESEFKGSVRKKLRLPIKTGGQELNWSIGVGRTTSSLYGQLIFLFDSWNGETKGKVIHLDVLADDDLAEKKKRKFRIREAVELIKKNQPTPETDKAKAELREPTVTEQGGL